MLKGNLEAVGDGYCGVNEMLIISKDKNSVHAHYLGMISELGAS